MAPVSPTDSPSFFYVSFLSCVAPLFIYSLWSRQRSKSDWLQAQGLRCEEWWRCFAYFQYVLFFFNSFFRVHCSHQPRSFCSSKHMFSSEALHLPSYFYLPSNQSQSILTKESLRLDSSAPASPTHPWPPAPIPCTGHEAWLAARTLSPSLSFHFYYISVFVSLSFLSLSNVCADISKQPCEQTELQSVNTVLMVYYLWSI